jgi:energy-coupling factor transport system ATP-binding protein
MKQIQFFQPPRSKDTVKLIDTANPIAANRASPMIEAKHLYFSYPDGEFGLKNVSLVIHKGEFVSISGPNGAGKTTLVKHFMGIMAPKKGDVLVDGCNTKDFSPAKLSSKVGFLFQNPESQIFADSILKEVSFSLKIRRWPQKKIRGCVERVLDSLGILKYADQHPYRLSRSLMQKVALASCLVHEPELIILDEPVSHMSYPQNMEILRLIEMLHSKGKTIIMITHDPLVVRYFSTRAITMENGRITKDTAESQFHSIAGSFLNTPQDALQ